MKKLLFTGLIFCLGMNVVWAETEDIHPIDRQESSCLSAAKNYEDSIKCINAAARAWYSEVDRYYSLLHKRLIGENKQNIYEGQKYWNLYKNYDLKVMNSLQENGFDTEQRALFRANQKRDMVKSRAEALRLYYIQTFSDDDSAKIEKHTKYNPDNVIIRGVRYMLR